LRPSLYAVVVVTAKRSGSLGLRSSLQKNLHIRLAKEIVLGRRGRVSSIHRISEKRSSRQPRLPVSRVLGNSERLGGDVKRA
jgi:hypothetical protein